MNPLPQTEIDSLIADALEQMRVNPGSGASITFHYSDDSGASGRLPAWTGLTRPEEQLTQLMRSPTQLPTKEVVGLEFLLDFEQPTGWLILFHAPHGDAWEWVENKTLSEAHREATRDRRHLDYGQTGYSLVRCPDKPIKRTTNPTL